MIVDAQSRTMASARAQQGSEQESVRYTQYRTMCNYSVNLAMFKPRRVFVELSRTSKWRLVNGAGQLQGEYKRELHHYSIPYSSPNPG
jgi:hypothetical protein